eukprot:PhF_6_TR44530/c0_g1_i1/m.68596/K14803/PTC2_3; protein phosphatase PTC2/3
MTDKPAARRTRADTTLQAPKPNFTPPSGLSVPTVSSPTTVPKSPSRSPSRVDRCGLTPSKGGSHPEFVKRVVGQCRCTHSQFPTKFALGKSKNVDYHDMFTVCGTCGRRGPEYLCLKCNKAFCTEHGKKHVVADGEHHLFLFNELVRYDEAFYCMKCESYLVVEPFDDFLDAMYASKGSFVNIPVTHKTTELFEGHGQMCASSTMQGWRSANEDSHCVYLGVPKYDHLDFVGVFDGHGGPLVSRYVGTKLITILESIMVKTPDIGQALIQTFIATDAALLTDPMLTQNETGGCGTTANVVIVDNIQNVYFCANAGDARAVLCRGGKAIPLSSDHRPGIASERERIRAAGSKISDDDRVEGLLAVSRAIGDFDFKQAGGLPPEKQAVTCVPDITKTPKHKDDEFIVVGCDGIWDCMQSQQVVDFICAQLRQHSSPIKSVEALLDKCVAKDVGDDGIGTDNMSVIVLMLK